MKTEDIIKKLEEFFQFIRRADFAFQDKSDVVKYIELRDEIINLQSLKSMREEKPGRKPDWMPDDDRVIGIDIIKRDAEIAHEQTMKNIEEHFKNLEKNLIISANDILRSCYQVIERKGESTNWDALEKKVKKVLEEQHSYLYPDSLQSSPQPQPGRGAEEALKQMMNKAYFSGANNEKSKEFDMLVNNEVKKFIKEYRTQSEGKDMYQKPDLSWEYNKNANGYTFDCWKRDGKLVSKVVIAENKEDAILLFKAKYPDYAFDEPY